MASMSEGTAWGRIDDELAAGLLEQRTLVMGGVLDEALGNRLCAGVMVLSARDPRADIHLWISSPGGSVPAMLAIRSSVCMFLVIHPENRLIRSAVTVFGLPGISHPVSASEVCRWRGWRSRPATRTRRT